jgi:uncharacterized protein (DUF1499 family)
MLQSYTYLLAATAILTLSQQSFGYSPNHHNPQPTNAAAAAAARQTSRRQLLSQLVATGTIAAVTTVTTLSEPALAAEEEEEGNVSSYSIAKCVPGSKSACVSTANVKNLDLYLPPWTFDDSRYSQAEVMSRLKGAIVSDSSCQIMKQDGSKYLKVEAKRNDIFDTIDELEFVVNDTDQVVFFRSRATNNENTDFGINKKRLEDIRKRAGIFGVMGEYMNTADSVSTAERGNGPLGQLKAFYGLQSGGGFEDVLRE